MTAQSIGLLSGGLVFLSIVPYAIRTYQGKIQPVATSWALWALIGLAILLTYRSSGAASNVWPAVFGFTNPLLITLLSVLRHGQWKRLAILDKICVVLGFVAIVIWMFVRRNQELAQYALYLAIAADLCAAIPTIVFVWTEPQGDRPFAWLIFAAGYLLAGFAIQQNTIANWILPLYMAAVAIAIAVPLALHRLRQGTPLKEWV